MGCQLVRRHCDVRLHLERERAAARSAKHCVFSGVSACHAGRRTSVGSRYVLGGMVVSFAAFFIALIYLYGLARQWLDHEQTVTALWLLASYPFALFYSAVYTESLYLCAAVGAFFHFHRGELLKASAWGLVVGLTRPNGCFLSVPLGILALEHVFARGLGPAGWWRRLLHGHMVSGQWSVASGQWPTANGQLPLTTHHRPLATVLAAAMPAIGMLLYSLFIYNLTGDAFAWAKGHLAWGRQYGGLSNLFVNSYVFVSYLGLYTYTLVDSAGRHECGTGFVRVRHDMAGLQAVWIAVRRLSADQSRSANPHWRISLGRALYVGSVPGVSCARAARASPRPSGVDRRVCDGASPQRDPFLYMAGAVLIRAESQIPIPNPESRSPIPDPQPPIPNPQSTTPRRSIMRRQ